MEITGKIKEIFETKDISASFKKREMVITTQEQYPQDILVDFIQDKTTLLDNYAVGQDVKIAINIRGREWKSPQGETKYFVSINGWRIDPLDAAASQSMGGSPYPGAQQPAAAQPMASQPSAQLGSDINSGDDDLPF